MEVADVGKWKYRPTHFMEADSHYDPKKADRAVTFIQLLHHTKGIDFAGKPFVLLPWQEQIVRDIFGIVKQDGSRQFRMAYVEIPKKNGKSELGAAIALYLLAADGERGAEVYSCAVEKMQAGIVYEVACGMIDQCAALKRRLKVLDATKRVIYPEENSKYVVLSSESKSKWGLNVSGCVFDELSAQPDRKLYDTMTKGASLARKQPLYFVITTAGNQRDGIGYEVHKKAIDILDGNRYDPTFYPVVYAAPDDLDWTSPEALKMANPSLGFIVDESHYASDLEDGKYNLAVELYFRQFYLNQWVDAGEKQWIQTEKWDDCAGPVDSNAMAGRTCYAGLDLALTGDISALVLVFPPQTEDEPFFIMPFFWVAEETLQERVKRDKVKYDIWAREQLICTTAGNTTHFSFIEQAIMDLSKIYNIRELVFDRWRADYLVQNLSDAGLTVVDFGQGFKDMSPASNNLMIRILEKKIAHGGNEVLRWMAKNVRIRTDSAGNIKPDKERSTEKIDGIVALIMALYRAVLCLNDTVSVYEERGLVVI
jgi:phage terminase large subunit-like protein